MTTYRVCCFLRRFRAASNEPSEAVGDVFRAYADGGGGLLGEEALRRFLREVQRETDAGADAAAKEVVAFAAEHRLLSKGGGLTAEGFLRWLFSDANAALDPRRGVYQDMGLPLSHYFIYTGHNSYLTGNQLSSGCSERPIVKALHDGVRVIELDLWPNAAKDDVEVLHGRTWTSPVELIRCLEAIKEHAFATSPYPVILTLEDHLNRDLQAKVAKADAEGNLRRDAVRVGVGAHGGVPFPGRAQGQDRHLHQGAQGVPPDQEQQGRGGDGGGGGRLGGGDLRRQGHRPSGTSSLSTHCNCMSASACMLLLLLSPSLFKPAS
ncbi:Phosphoinositide phospholipase C 2 [Zea mays]|uniref:Phosphoinositide phospholipase C n=1 Tax=Zea mays TaxID=4577 RepID=A0A3L6DDS0_MAIZE|nr:Phosphoinositide phospholipase C 2 [Zea mays]